MYLHSYPLNRISALRAWAVYLFTRVTYGGLLFVRCLYHQTDGIRARLGSIMGPAREFSGAAGRRSRTGRP